MNKQTKIAQRGKNLNKDNREQKTSYLETGRQLLKDIKTINEIKQRLKVIADSNLIGCCYEVNLEQLDDDLIQVISSMGEMTGFCITEEILAGNNVVL